ncbi:uncharacterized protein SOCE26_051000 [Sorangium cellulosum]|uniref:Uncharacterized protein n=1 Tax=Sorangium cellulosum TaxID=56 RepID=A0A2L0EWG9_SORCE|nr:hypothetical protein [Sorangium cellulosum]AUX43648.1 uncharacterized protein SOCE26_051000 [Sorangium cellulosum]
MKRDLKGYEPIEDFTCEGRQRLVEERGEEIRFLLEAAFEAFLDAEPYVNLAAFGFRGDEQVFEAVEWAITRFATGNIDPTKLRNGSRSFRLFTEVRFWLSQKVGLPGFRHILAAAKRPRSATPPEELPAAQAEPDAEVLDFGRALAGALPSFRERTCADLVGYWLEGTKRLRRDWFGWRERGELSEAAERRSKKQRSIHTHDAMFRFLCCFLQLVPAASSAAADLALEITSLSGCPDRPPYRVPDRDVCGELARFGVRGPRQVSVLRKQGAGSFLHRCLDRARADIDTVRGLLTSELTRKSLSLTTLHALEIEGDMALRARIDEVRSGADQEEYT